MEIINRIYVKNRKELRAWLLENGDKEPCCWIEVKRGEPKDKTSFWYIDAVEEAICFGWIDGITKKVSENETLQRLSPRRKNSNWTELNKQRARRMEKLGLMTEAGRRILPDMTTDLDILFPDIIGEIRKDKEVYKIFKTLPELYKRVKFDGIYTKEKLARFMEATRQGKMYGQWNDYGRLIDY